MTDPNFDQVLEDEMKYAGGTQYGTITKGQFHGVLVKLFTRHILFTDDLLAMICNAYGTGLVDHKCGASCSPFPAPAKHPRA